MNIYLLIFGLILFVGLVVVHEFGHYIAARRNGVEVEEFGIGFPPRIWKKKLKNKTLFTLNLLPLGGFVKLKGEHDADTEPGSYGASSLWAKSKIILAGVVMNLIVAWVLFTIVALIGMPKVIDNQFSVKSDSINVKSQVLVGDVEPGSPAEKLQLKPNDQIVSIGAVGGSTTKVTASEQISNFTRQNAGKTIEVTYLHDGVSHTAQTTLRQSQEVNDSQKVDPCTQQAYLSKGYLGVYPAQHIIDRSTWSAPIVSAGTMAQFTKLTFQGLGSAIGGLFRGKTCEAASQVSGPVGIFVILKDGSLLGIQFILLIVAIISLTLAIMNILPIPALDGGRLFVTLLFRIMRKPLSAKTEEIIHGTGFFLLIALFIVVTVVDIRRFF